MSRPKSIIVVNNDYRILSDRFYSYQKRLGYAKETCRTRQLNVNEFLSWLEQRGRTKIEEIKPNEIQSYYQYLKTRPSKQRAGKLSDKYVYTVIKSIDQLFTMLQTEGKLKINPVGKLKLKYPNNQQTRKAISQEEINQLYQACETVKERAILSLAYGCGLRAGELENINKSDIKLRANIIVVTKGKGNKRRIVPLSKGVKEDLYRYHKIRERQINNQQSEHAFILNKRGRRMRKYTYNKELKKLVKRTKIEEEITIHTLRHSIASHLLKEGVPVEQVRDFLGHSQLETTQVYTHINKEQLKEMMNET